MKEKLVNFAKNEKGNSLGAMAERIVEDINEFIKEFK